MIIIKNKLNIEINLNAKEIKDNTTAPTKLTTASKKNHFFPATSSSLQSQANK